MNHTSPVNHRTLWISGGEELRFSNREDQELRAYVEGNKPIFKMSSENQTENHTNKIMGNDHDSIFV